MKFSIVTPAYNSEKYIAETIESVLSQKGDFEIEYIIVDGCSSDKTVDIIKKYERKIKERAYIVNCRNLEFKWVSEKDRGMYDAINKGFEMATGDIYAWINSNDIYLPGAFNGIHKVYSKYPQVKWLKGITSFINEDSNLYQAGRCYLFDRSWIRKGIYGRAAYFIEQDSVFWRSELWRSNGGIDPGLKLAGDFYLWSKFAETADLYVLKSYVSCFRIHEGQLSRNMASYYEECERSCPFPVSLGRKIKNFFKRECRIPQTLRPYLYRLVFGKQEMYLFELKGNEPVMKKVNYYIG